jgi:FMN phosphatase YigB (HAD superfamily)
MADQTVDRGRPALISVDVGGTIGRASGPVLTSVLAESSPLPRRRVDEAVRQHLSRALCVPTTLIESLCELVDVDPAVASDYVPPKLCPLPGARQALKLLSEIAPVVTLSNVSALDFDEDELSAVTDPYVVAHYPSCRTGRVKPDPRAFLAVSDRHQVPISEVIHIGDNWECDVVGATAAGAKAIWLREGRRIRAPGLTDQAPDLAAAAHALLLRHAEPTST